MFEKFRSFKAILQTENQFFRANFQKISIFSGNFTKNSIFQGKFPKNFDLLGNFKKISIFSENFQNISNFFGNFTKNFDFPTKNWLFTAISRQIILFLFKSHHFRTYFLYMIRYTNIL